MSKLPAQLIGFNPLPAFRPGDTAFLFASRSRAGVSIRSRLFGREIRESLPPGNLIMAFQSAPGFSAGRYLRWRVIRQHPVRVSIRSRLFGREIPAGSVVAELMTRFQSAPGFSAGRYAAPRWPAAATPSFNPLPAFRPGDTVGPGFRRRARRGFNPLPAFRPGDTPGVRKHAADAMVSIRSRLFGREIRARHVGLEVVEGVSIRSRLFGREIPLGLAQHGREYRFQSAPGFSAGRYEAGAR